MCIYIESKYICNIIYSSIIYIAIKYIKIFQGVRVLGFRPLHMLKGKIFHCLTSKAYTLVMSQLFEIIQRSCRKVYHGENDSTLIFVMQKNKGKERTDRAYRSMPWFPCQKGSSVQHKYETTNLSYELSQ